MLELPILLQLNKIILTPQNVRITLEIGHEASVRNKRTVEGFTHDWEVFVRGLDGADIYHFIDKVIKFE